MTSALLLTAVLSACQAERVTWEIEGVEREAVVYPPAKRSEGGPPLVFGFHGHGGRVRNAARTFRFQDLWPEAVVVYMQGLPTPGKLTDPEGKKPGWQHDKEAQGGRDLKFFDAVLASMKKRFGVDPNRIYCTGHSNGGGFTYLLAGARPGVFAAVAPSAAAGIRHLRGASPVPLMHIAGRRDTLVKFEWQEWTMKAARRLNGCEGKGETWEKIGTRYASTKGAEVVTLIHDGTHKYPPAAPGLIVKFFKAQVRPSKVDR